MPLYSNARRLFPGTYPTKSEVAGIVELPLVFHDGMIQPDLDVLAEMRYSTGITPEKSSIQDYAQDIECLKLSLSR
jgi:hypothetical protein